MQVLLDTNIFVADFSMSGNQFQVFFNECRAGRLQLIMSKVVEQEVVNIYAEHLKGHLDVAKKVYSKLRTHYGIETPAPTLPSLAAARNEYAERLHRAVTQARGVTLHYPAVSHEAMLDRILNRRKPSSVKDEGYRDSIIWEQVVELASSGSAPVVLISGDVAAYGEGDELAPELVKELATRGVDTNRVHRFATLKAFVNAVVPTARQFLVQLEQLLTDSEFLDGLLDRVDAEIESWGPWVGISLRDREFEDPELSYLHAFAPPIFTDAKELNGGQVLVDGYVDCDADIAATLDRDLAAGKLDAGEVELVEDSSLSPFDSEVRVLINRQVRVYFEAAYHPNDRNLEELQVVAMEADPQPRMVPSQQERLFH